MIEDEDFRKKCVAYHLKPESDVNEDKFWRYPLKEQLLPNKYMVYENIPDEKAYEWNKVAHAQRLIQYDVCQTKTAKKEDVTFVEKFCAYLDTKTATTHEAIFIELFQFYVEQNKPLNKKQLKDYAYLYMAKKNLITAREFYYLKE